jgi:hypothetical protein
MQELLCGNPRLLLFGHHVQHDALPELLDSIAWFRCGKSPNSIATYFASSAFVIVIQQREKLVVIRDTRGGCAIHDWCFWHPSMETRGADQQTKLFPAFQFFQALQARTYLGNR